MATNNKQSMSRRIRWALIGILATVLLASWTWNQVAPVVAAPVEVPKRPSASDEPEVVSAMYVPGSMTLIVLPQGIGEEMDKPKAVLTAMIEAEISVPGRSETITRTTPSVLAMSIPDLEKFPGPLEMLDGDHCFDLYVMIDHEDPEQGLRQIQRAHEIVVHQRAASQAGETEEQTEAAAN